VILRGGKTPNYDARMSRPPARTSKRQAAVPLMVDCSHANSSKQHEQQVDVARDIAARSRRQPRIFGVMVESHLTPARRSSARQGRSGQLVYGQSITDACIGWEHSLQVLDALSLAVKAASTLSVTPASACNGA
jgi:3-deoxy-7-phosphoheptulonate synthase